MQNDGGAEYDDDDDDGVDGDDDIHCHDNEAI